MKLKRFFALMLALTLSLTMLQGVAFANSGTVEVTVGGTKYDLSYYIENDTAHIYKSPQTPAISASAAGALVIPATVEHNGTKYTVTRIGFEAFNGCASLTSVNIPAGVTEIRQNVFNGCTSLQQITIPDSLTGIGQYAFNGCTSLQQITLPAGLIGIGSSAFEGCTALTSVTFNGSAVTTIGDYVFEDANQLTTINLAGDYDAGNTDVMIGNLAAALTNASLNLANIKINYNDTWPQAGIDALTNAGFTNINPYNPNPAPTQGGSTGGGSAGAGAWYIGTLAGGNGSDFVPTYTQIVDTPDTTAMLNNGNVITVTGQSPTGVIVKLDPTALAGKQSLSINSSIADMQLTAEQIASLIQQAGDNTIHITIKQTADGSTISILAGGRTITL